MKNKKLLTIYGIILLSVVCLIVLGIILGSASAVFKKLLEANLVWVILASSIIVVSFCLLIFVNFDDSNRKWSTQELVTGSLSISLAFILSYVRLYKLPQGGAITAASMLPIFIFSYLYGFRKAVIVAVAYGILQYIQDPGEVVHWAQIFMDYIFAFGSLSIAGLFKKNVVPGIVAGGLTRLLFSALSGMIFFAEYAPEGQNPFMYSLIYNGSYMLPDIAICVVIAIVPAMQKFMKSLKNE